MIRVPRKVIRDADAVTGSTTTSITPRFLLALLDDAGQPADDLLARIGAAREALSQPDFRLPLDAFRELWARAAAVQPDIGLTMVERFPAGQMHVLAHLALRSATVGAAVADMCRYAALTSSADHHALQHGAGVARYQYECRAPGLPNPWLAEHYLSMTVVFLVRAVGRAIALRAVEFAAPAQAPLAAYRRRFGVTPRFDAEVNALEFDAQALDWPLATHDAYLHAILERVAQAQRDYAPDSPLDATRREIGKSLLKGTTPTIDAIAQACRLTARALRDRLAQSQTTFRLLRDEVCRDLAREHLGRGMSVSETAYLLGFSEPAAFQHACKRWFDRSAGELRRQLLSDPGGTKPL
jgi:AraC-like DNA-binding protein